MGQQPCSPGLELALAKTDCFDLGRRGIEYFYDSGETATEIFVNVVFELYSFWFVFELICR
jgi:hypothetical protein